MHALVAPILWKRAERGGELVDVLHRDRPVGLIAPAIRERIERIDASLGLRLETLLLGHGLGLLVILLLIRRLLAIVLIGLGGLSRSPRGCGDASALPAHVLHHLRRVGLRHLLAWTEVPVTTPEPHATPRNRN